MSKAKNYWLLFLIVALGFYLRVVNIDTTPPGVYPDEAVNGIDALSALNGNWEWFYEANNGREGLFMNLIALCFKFLGISPLTLRLPAIIFGTLTILGTYLLTAELFQKRALGLISSFLVAVSFWPLNFSRISFRANMLPFVLVFCFYFLWKGLRIQSFSPSGRDVQSQTFGTGQRGTGFLCFALSGFFFGLGLHTYIAFRIAPLILIMLFISLMLSRTGFFKNYWRGILLFVFVATIAASPMLYTFATHPQYIESRTGNVSILNPEVNQGHLVITFFKSLWLSIAKYNIWGDQNWRHNYPPYPLLDPVTGIAFAFGFVFAVLKLIHLFSARLIRKTHPHTIINKNPFSNSSSQSISIADETARYNGVGVKNPKMDVYALLVSWFFIMLIPEFMTAEGNPHALRSIGTLPVVFIFSALAFNYFLIASEKYTFLFKKMTVFLILLILLSIGIFNTAKYHLFWAKKIETAKAFDQNIMDASNYLKTIPYRQEKFIVAEVMQRIPIELFNQNLPNAYYIYPGEINQLSPKGKNNFIIILADWNEEIVASLKNKFPDLELTEKKDKFGLSFYVLNPNY